MSYPSIDPKLTGRKIKHFVAREDLTSTEVAERLGLASRSTFYKWLRGDALPSLDNLYALSLLLRVPINDLIVTSEDLTYRKIRKRVSYISDHGKTYHSKSNSIEKKSIVSGREVKNLSSKKTLPAEEAGNIDLSI